MRTRYEHLETAGMEIEVIKGTSNKYATYGEHLHLGSAEALYIQEGRGVLSYRNLVTGKIINKRVKAGSNPIIFKKSEHHRLSALSDKLVFTYIIDGLTTESTIVKDTMTPELPLLKIYVIDLDGPISEDIDNEAGPEKMLKAKAYRKSIKRINKLYNEGNYICIFTARTNKHKEASERWLKKHGVKYDQIIYNKPRKKGPYKGYHYIDNAYVQATTLQDGAIRPFVTKNMNIEVFE